MTEKKQSGKDYEYFKQIYGMTERLNERNPDQLQQKLTLYGTLYELTGKFEAEAYGEAELYDFQVKNLWDEIYLQTKTDRKTGDKLTAKEREAIAELGCKELRQKRYEAKSEMKRWEMARESILEQINIMKRKQDSFNVQWEKANYINGG